MSWIIEVYNCPRRWHSWYGVFRGGEQGVSGSRDCVHLISLCVALFAVISLQLMTAMRNRKRYHVPAEISWLFFFLNYALFLKIVADCVLLCRGRKKKQPSIGSEDKRKQKTKERRHCPVIITTHSVFSEALDAESIRVLLFPPPYKRFLAIFNLTSKAGRGGERLASRERSGFLCKRVT